MTLERQFRDIRRDERASKWTYVWRGVRRFVMDSGQCVDQTWAAHLRSLQRYVDARNRARPCDAGCKWA
jgi:hypothetical protein